jgi:hypothetical protein
MNVRIKENSWLARIAAKRLKSKQVAMVLGSTIHLYNTSREDFLENKRWLRHELAHVRQYAEHGFVRFLFLYLLESMRSGYRNNRFEVEARQQEASERMPEDLFIT